jgi:micrococcal nuclease
VFDETADRRGYYGRLLAYVYVDGQSFNYALVQEGHARLYESTFTERERYAAAEVDARTAGRGLWSCATETTRSPTPSTPRGSVAADVAVDVVRVHPDAEGPENENLGDEYIVLRNDGDERVDLSGWTIADAAGATYTVPAGTTLAPGSELTLRTGTGTDGDGTLYWGRASAVWNNDGDTVIVRDGAGTLVVERRY